MKRRGRGRPCTDPAVRFWSKVRKTEGCWIWTDAPTADGYGRFFDGTKKVLAHRYSWELHGGEQIDGKELDHECINGLCVRPKHLRIATRKQNQENLSGAYWTNQTGVRGVMRTRNGRPYAATMHHNKERHYLGRFDTLEEAERAVVSKRLELFTHNEADKADAERLGICTHKANAARRINQKESIAA